MGWPDRHVQRDFGGTERFLIEARLGVGGMGIVYRAFDRERGARVALKTLRSAPEGDALYRFKKEFRALAELDHPNLVRLYDLFCEDDRWFFTMELLDGRGFLHHVHDEPYEPVASTLSTLKHAPLAATPREGRALDDASGARLRASLRQLAVGLDALHDKGMLHRDIKPSNVFVTNEGRVVLLDFGLVTELGRSTADVAGTPVYMAPEQGASTELSTAADWYAVGVMLYEALVGIPPFVGGSFDELMMRKATLAPLPPSDVMTDVPEDLDALCRELLARKPEARPNGKQVLQRLGFADVSRSVQTQSRVELVGRDAELTALAHAYASSCIVLVSGPPGIGKSALVAHSLDVLAASEPKPLVLVGRCYEREAVPYKALDDIVDALVEYLLALPAEQQAKLLPAGVGELARIFPVFKRIDLAAHATPTEKNAREVKKRAGSALRALLSALATTTPTVVFVDDLHWADGDSVALLVEILRLPRPAHLVFVGTSRFRDFGTSEPLQELLRSEEPLGGFVHIAVGPLEPAAAIALARARLGPQVAAAATVAAEAGGIPLFVAELARYAETGASLGAHVTLQDLLRSRIAGLPGPAQRLLEVLAIAGRPTDAGVALRAANLADQSYAALADLRAGNLIRVRSVRGGEALEPYHDRVRENVLETLDAPTQREHHARIAIELERWGRAGAETLAIHFRAGGDFASALGFAVEAAREANEALAYMRAARLYRMALRLKPPTDLELMLRAELASTLTTAGHGAEAGREYIDLARRAAPGEAIQHQRRAAEELLRSGHVDEGLRVLGSALAEVGLSAPASSRRALLRLIVGRVQTRLRGLRYRERAESDISPPELLRVDTCWSGAIGLGMTDFIRGAQMQNTHLLLALAAGEPKRLIRALACEAVYSATAGRASERRTREVMRALNELGERLDPFSRGYAFAGSGMAEYLLGNRKVGFELCKRGAEIFLAERRELSWSWELTTSRLFMLWSLYYTGELRELAARVPELLEDAFLRGDLYAAAVMRVGHCNCAWLTVDDLAEARRHEREAVDQWSRRDFHLQRYHTLLAQTQLDLYEGAARSAWQRITDVWPALARSLLLRNEDVRIEAYFQRARAALAVAETEPDGRVLGSAARDAKRLLREGTWGTGWGHLALAGVAFQRHRDEQAVESLARAEHAFVAHDMKLFAAVAKLRAAQIVGGDEGNALDAEARSAIADAGVVNVERWSAMLAPGFERR